MRISLLAFSLVVGLWSLPAQAASIHEHTSERSDPPRIFSGVGAVPEPSAMTLFGVGVLLVVQAIPRRSLRSSSDNEFGTRRTG